MQYTTRIKITAGQLIREYTGLSLYFTKPFTAVPIIIIMHDKILSNNKECSVIDTPVFSITNGEDDDDATWN